MEEFSRYWFDVSLQGVAFMVPVYTEQVTVSSFRYELVNNAYASILKRTQNYFSKQLTIGLFPDEEDADFFDRLKAVLHTGEPQQFYKLGQDGRDCVWLYVTITRINQQLMVNIQDVSEQKKSEQELQRRLTMESILAAVSSRFIQVDTDNLDACITDALAQISGHIGTERAAVIMYSDDYQRASCVYEWCAPGILSRKEANQHVPITSFVWTYQQLESGQPVYLEIDKISPDAIPEKKFFGNMAVHSMIAIPLIQERKTQGFIAFYAISLVQQWDHNDISLLKTFSTLVATVVERLKQQTALKRANQRLEGLHEIDQALLSRRMSDKSPLLTALQYLHFMVPCEQIVVFHMDEITRLAVAKYQIVDGNPAKNPGIVITDLDFYDRFLTHDELSVFGDLEADASGVPPKVKQRLQDQRLRSLALLPLFSQQECIGVLMMASASPYFFSQEDIRIAQELASQLTIVLYQQQLDERFNEYTEQLEQRVDERTREIRRLSAVQQAILQHAGQAILSTDINGVIKTANQACEKLLGYRVSELIGRAARIEPVKAGEQLPVVSYRPVELAEEGADSLLEILSAQGYFQAECLVNRQDGSTVPVLMTSSRLIDDNNTPIGYVGIATDISALKDVELKLQEKNQELNTIFEGAIDLHCIVSIHGEFLRVNRAWDLALGYSRDELAQLTFAGLVEPTEKDLFLQNIRELINHSPVRNQLNHFRKKDGTYIALEWNAIRVNAIFYASARDVTERQQAEEKLKSLNQRLQLATDAAGQGVWEMDLENDRLIWDNRLSEMHGLPPEPFECSFQTFLDMIHPEDRADFLATLADRQLTNVVARVVLPTGSIRYMETSGAIIKSKEGKAIWAVGVVADITERKLAEEALRESEQRFREIAENVDEIFWIHSADPFELLYVNSAYERVTGQSSQSLYDNPESYINAILEEDRPIFQEFMNQYKAGQEGQIYYRQKGPDGAIRWFSTRTFVVHDSYGKIVRHIGIANDVTSQKEKELVLRQSLQREQELNQLKSQFVATASHEFRTPLATIQSSVDLIRFYLSLPSAKATATIEHHLNIIGREIDQFGSLLSDILTIGTIEAGKVKFTPRRVDIVAVCQEIIKTHFGQQRDQRRVELFMEGSPYNVFIDDKLISHVIVNLLSNAFKFSKENPILRLIFNEKTLVIKVTDRGIGIPAHDLSALFQAFFRASNSTGIPGTGLGLIIARQFVELHNGYLDIQSEEKKGTICTITLPASSLEPAYQDLSLASPSN